MAWKLEVTEAKVLYAPVGKTKNKEGEERTRFIPMGIKITMADGEWWFRHRKYGSWTRHIPGSLKTYKSGTPIIGTDGKQEREPEKTSRYASDAKLAEAYAHCPLLLDTLRDAMLAAIAEDAAKKAA